MTLAPLLTAPFAVQLHVCAALCALALGPLALWRRSRDRWHKRLGYLWVTAMMVTVWGLWQGVRAARLRRIAQHRNAMQSLYFWAMGIAGLLTFLPGRRMNAVFFADAPLWGFLGMAGLIGAGLLWYVRAHGKSVLR